MDKAKEYREWLIFADDDIQTAELLNNQHRKSLNIICFHCQQAAEKYLKAFLVSRNISFEKTHDLIYLCNTCSAVENDFSSISKDCYKLNPFSVITRYPSDLELIDSDAVTAINSARSIEKIVLDKIKSDS